jgi:hypothetical protein
LEILALPDLVRAKKTQKDKDWPMIRRLIEAHYARHRNLATPLQISFWFQEARTVSLLIELARLYPEVKAETARQRPLLASAEVGNESELEVALAEEERREREAGRQHWLPLKKELEQLRHRHFQ